MSYSRKKILVTQSGADTSSVLLIYTGGTVGMGHDQEGSLIPFDFSMVLDHIPSLRAFDLTLSVVAIDEPIDSSNVNPAHWRLLGQIIHENYEEFDAFVVLHGTDTMAYTASAMSFVLRGLNKPVIFTGAQLPISAIRSDARENILTAIDLASATIEGEPIVPEVCIYFNNFLLRGNRSKKVESNHFDAFESENYPALAEAGISIDYNHSYIRKVNRDSELQLHTEFDRNVAILKLFPGICKAVVNSILSIKGLKGVVIETFGAGNAPTESWFLDCVRNAVERGLIVLNVSQCMGGQVVQGKYETSQHLEKIGVLSGWDITTESAVTKMMHLLGSEQNNEIVKQRIVKPICGEMSVNVEFGDEV
ncbi:MAG: asparaginase [Bacteroidota bacterium]